MAGLQRRLQRRAFAQTAVLVNGAQRRRQIAVEVLREPLRRLGERLRAGCRYRVAERAQVPAIASSASSGGSGRRWMSCAKRKMPGASAAPASTAGVCCKPMPTTSTGQPWSPSWSTRRARRPLGATVCSSSMVRSSAAPRHMAVREDASSSENRLPACVACSLARPAFSQPTRRVVRLSSSANSRPILSASSVRAMAMNKSTSLSSRLVFTARWLTVGARLPAAASSANLRPSCVLPTPGTPVTSDMPPRGSPVAQSRSSRSVSAASSALRPAKHGRSRWVPSDAAGELTLGMGRNIAPPAWPPAWERRRAWYDGRSLQEVEAP